MARCRSCKIARASTPTRATASQEHALSSYLKLHPVLSLESTSCQTLQLVANLVEDTSIPTKELEVVPKPHDDAYLRPPNVAIGERPCCLGDRCICVWLARWRYGDDTDMAFIGTEFLLPSHAAEFKESGKLPHTNGKCLVCSRYVHTFIYQCARADPTFKPSASIPLQAFGNALGVEAGENLPTHASVANDCRRLPAGGAALRGRAVGRHGRCARRHGLAALAAVRQV